MTSELLELRGVSRIYMNGRENSTVLHGIDLTIRAGEMVAIVGRSGSGKSTFLNILVCLDRPTDGQYRIAGQDTRGLDPDTLARLRREYFGFIFQRYDLLQHLTAIENVEMPALYTGIDKATRQRRALDLLARFGLAHRVDYRPAQLSGGQQQRVGIARALINGGAVILADEPTGALDRASHDEVLKHLRNLHREGHTVVIVTHDPEVAACSDRIIEIEDGRIVADRRSTAAENRVVASPPADHADSRRGQWSLESLKTSLVMAWHAMASHHMRTALTMLGIVIGIASVIAVTGLGQGAKQRVVADLNALGTHTVDIYPGNGRGDESPEAMRALREPDLSVLAAQPYIDSISPVIHGTGVAIYGNLKLAVATVGVNQAFFRASNTAMAAGVAFSADDIARRAQVAVIDENLRRRVFGADRDALGEIILIGRVPFRIIGVTAARKSLLGNSQSLNVWIPYTTQKSHLMPQDHFSSIKLRMKSNSKTWQMADVEKLLIKHHGRKDFFVSTNESLIQSVERTATTLTMMVSAIAVVSLIVGGVGVMNIMLVSVSERTREIGIRMAVGARQADIRQQFLIEAILICLVGGLLGVALAWSIGTVLGWIQDTIAMRLSPLVVCGACLTAALTGVGFGFVPARNASKLDPVSALARG